MSRFLFKPNAFSYRRKSCHYSDMQNSFTRTPPDFRKTQMGRWQPQADGGTNPEKAPRQGPQVFSLDCVNRVNLVHIREQKRPIGHPA